MRHLERTLKFPLSNRSYLDNIMSAKLVFSAWLLKTWKKNSKYGFSKQWFPSDCCHLPTAALPRCSSWQGQFWKSRWCFAHWVPSLHFWELPGLLCLLSKFPGWVWDFSTARCSFSVEVWSNGGFGADYVHISHCLEMFGFWFLCSWQFRIPWAGSWVKPGKNEGMSSEKCSVALLWVLTLDFCKTWSKTFNKVPFMCLK